MSIVQITVVGAWMPVIVVVSSQLDVSVVSVVPVELWQLIVADVTSGPPSRNRTWMSAVGVSVNEVVSPTYGSTLQLVLVSTVTECPVASSITYPVGAAVSVTV